LVYPVAVTSQLLAIPHAVQDQYGGHGILYNVPHILWLAMLYLYSVRCYILCWYRKNLQLWKLNNSLRL